MSKREELEARIRRLRVGIAGDILYAVLALGAAVLIVVVYSEYREQIDTGDCAAIDSQINGH